MEFAASGHRYEVRRPASGGERWIDPLRHLTGCLSCTRRRTRKTSHAAARDPTVDAPHVRREPFIVPIPARIGILSNGSGSMVFGEAVGDRRADGRSQIVVVAQLSLDRRTVSGDGQVIQPPYRDGRPGASWCGMGNGVSRGRGRGGHRGARRERRPERGNRGVGLGDVETDGRGWRPHGRREGLVPRATALIRTRARRTERSQQVDLALFGADLAQAG